MRFSVLGPVSVSAPDGPVPIAAPKQRLLLAHLLSRTNTALPPENLIDLLWGERPPSSARKALAWHVLQLRNSLGGKDRLAWRRGGYVLVTGPEELDAVDFTQRFQRAAVAAKDGDVAAASTLLDAALGLWRGPAYGDLAETGVLREEANRLDELRLLALESRGDVDLELGRHADIVPELSGLVAEHPFRERFRSALMLALYRCGRQADALRVFREGRTRFVEELGLEPGPALRRLEQRILSADPRLESAKPAAAPAVVPAQLPADLRSFSGRQEEVTRLLELAESSPTAPGTILVGALDGMAGIGKTTLAVHVAQRLAPRFPDGQLFVDLHGFTEGVAPIEPGQALERMLRALGTAPDAIPDVVDDRAALYRSLLADRRVLVVLDNALGEEQVAPLLPGSTGSLVLITSRRRLAGLEDTRYLQLDVLSPAEAVALLLRSAAVDRPSPQQRLLAAEVAELCGRLPLAIRIAAAKLRHRRHWTLATVAERLSGERQRLDQLELGERSVSAAFAMSYDDIDAGAQRVFRLLGLFPGTHFDARLAAAAVGEPVATVEEHLDTLVEANLLLARMPGRFGFHDLMRRFAVRAATRAHDAAELALVNTRMFEWYLRAAFDAAVTVYDSEPRLPEAPAIPEHGAVRFDGAPEASAWADAERRNVFAVLTAAARAEHVGYCWRIRVAFNKFIEWSSDRQDIEVQTRALELVTAVDDAYAQASLSRTLGIAHVIHGDADSGIALSLRSIGLWRRLGDLSSQASVSNNLGVTYYRIGRYADAIAILTESVDLARRADDGQAEAIALVNLANVHESRHELDLALRHQGRARELFHAQGRRQFAMVATDNLGTIHRQLGNLAEAMRWHREVVEYHEAGHHLEDLIAARTHLGIDHREAGDLELSRQILQTAVRGAHADGDMRLRASAHTELGRTVLAQGEPAAAIEHLRRATELARLCQTRLEEAQARHGLGDALERSGEAAAAREELAAARDLYAELGVSDAAALTRRLERSDSPVAE